MKARLLDLKSKYYGTKIELYDETADETIDTICLWISSSYENGSDPSDRELAGYDLTRQQFDDNVLYDGSPVQGELFCWDQHYETQGTYTIALNIIKAINGGEWIHGESPRDGEEYWVAVTPFDNKPIVFLATAYEYAANGWASGAWEDWDKEVIAYQKAIIPTYP